MAAMMKQEVKQMWINALRSGEYNQCRDKLKKTNGNKESFCCLGVLTDLAIKDSSNNESWNDFEEYVFLPGFVMNWAGMNNINSTGRLYNYNTIKNSICLSDKNDFGASFKQIADMIEKNIEGY